jgi:PAS domain S-box-containing protein
VALLASAAALALSLALEPLVLTSTLPPFLVAVLVTAWFGGLGPGLVATILTALVNAYFFMVPGQTFVTTTASSAARLALFIGSAVAIAAVAARLRGARQEAALRAREAAAHQQEMQRSMAALRSSEARFRGLVELAPDGIVIADRDGRIVVANAEAHRLFGYVPGELAGQAVDALVPARAREGHAGLRESYHREPRVRPMGAGLDLFGRRKDGTEFPVEISLSPLETPEGAMTTAVVRDVTERRRSLDEIRASEARFRGLLELAPDGIVIADRHGRIVIANTEAHRLFGYGPGALSGQDIETLVPDRLRERHVRHREAYHREPRTRPMGAGLELLGRRKDGSEFPVEISLSPMETAAGVFVTGVVRDASDRKRTEERITALNRDLERRVGELNAVNRELEAFSYSVSHDLRAPLRAIDGFSQALLEEYGARLDAEGHDYLRRVRAAAQRMAELIDDLLDLSRVTRREMRREPVDLTALARAAVEQIRRAEPERQVDVVIAEGLVAEGDPHLLRVALENLLGNAWKFTGGQPRARIEVGATRRDGLAAYFVADNGVGFDMAHAGKLFGAFQRLHGMTAFPGTGIGLATVQRIVHRHGGQIWADAAPGRGATFHFTLAEGAARDERQAHPAGRGQS